VKSLSSGPLTTFAPTRAADQIKERSGTSDAAKQEEATVKKEDGPFGRKRLAARRIISEASDRDKSTVS